MTAAMDHTIRITADEVNCLIYAYLIDSGFTHSAFAVKMEGQLDRSPNASKHIPRGELIELLGKSLLYTEVESHWKGNALTNNCKSGFSLLEPHICSSEVSQEKPAQTVSSQVLFAGPTKEPKLNGVSTDATPKRKESPTTVPTEGPVEKRAKRDMEDMEVDASTESVKAKGTSSDLAKVMNTSPEPASKRSAKPKQRSQGPGDEVTTPDAIVLLPAHKTEVFVCAFNPARHGILASGSKDATVKLWDLTKAPESYADPTVIDFAVGSEQGDLTSLHWNSDGTLLAVGSYDSLLRICTPSGSLYFSSTWHKGPIFSVRFSRTGKWLLTASLDNTFCVWDVNGKRLHKQYRCHSDCCLDVDWLDDETFATCGADRVLFIMRVDQTQPLKKLVGHTDEINQVKCSPSRTRVATCSDDMTARVWNLSDLDTSIPGFIALDAVVVLQGHKHSVSTLSWCPDQTLGPHPLIATSSFDGTARIWDSVTGECLKIFTDHKRPVYTVTFSPNGHFVASGGGDGWFYVYHVPSYEKRWSWYAGAERPGVFEITWEIGDGINRIALALECRQVAVIDANKIPALQAPRRTGTKAMYAT